MNFLSFWCNHMRNLTLHGCIVSLPYYGIQRGRPTNWLAVYNNEEDQPTGLLFTTTRKTNQLDNKNLLAQWLDFLQWDNHRWLQQTSEKQQTYRMKEKLLAKSKQIRKALTTCRNHAIHSYESFFGTSVIWALSDFDIASSFWPETNFSVGLCQVKLPEFYRGGKGSFHAADKTASLVCSKRNSFLGEPVKTNQHPCQALPGLASSICIHCSGGSRLSCWELVRWVWMEKWPLGWC